MAKDILYGVKLVEVEEIDPTTQLPKDDGVSVTIDTAEKVEFEAQFSEGKEDIKRNDNYVIAVVRTPDLLIGYDLKFTDNTFDPLFAGLIEGGILTLDKNGIIESYRAPMLSEGADNMKPFRLSLYVPSYMGDTIQHYVKIIFNNCSGKAPNMEVGTEFYSPEFEIKAREATKAGLPIKEMQYIEALPELSHVLRLNANGGTLTGAAELRVKSGEKPNLTDPTLSGKTFAGWVIVGGSNTPIDKAAFKMPNKDLTLKATWK